MNKKIISDKKNYLICDCSQKKIDKVYSALEVIKSLIQIKLQRLLLTVQFSRYISKKQLHTTYKYAAGSRYNVHVSTTSRPS